MTVPLGFILRKYSSYKIATIRPLRRQEKTLHRPSPMKLFFSFFAALAFSSSWIFSKEAKLPKVPTQAEAIAAITAEMQAREAREADRKASIEAVPASEEWEADHGDRKTVLRRVAPPPPRLTTRQSESADKIANSPKWTEAQIAEWIAKRPEDRTLNLSATVYDQAFTEITWRDENRNEWTILSNIDFRYFAGIGHFDDERHRWITFLFVDEVNSDREARIARYAREKGFDYTPRTADRWLSRVPGDFLRSTESEYIVVAESEESTIPQELYEELDALHRYYDTHEERLIAEYERNKVLKEARRAWHEANPPEPKDSVINFWRIR